MDECIERERLLRKFNIDDMMNVNGTLISLHDARETISNFPASDVVPVRHGRWIDAYPDIEPDPMFMYGICSECGFEQAISKYLNYCPNCGAKMDGAE